MLAEPENLKIEFKIWRWIPDADSAFLDLAFLNVYWCTSQICKIYY